MQKRLLWTVGILLVFGLAVLSSAGIVDAQKKFGSPYYYVYHQLLFGVLPGLVLAWLISRVKYDVWRRLALPILFGALVLMALVFVPGLSYGAKGAVRWINFHGFVFQPSEILKLALVVYFAAWFGSRQERLRSAGYGVAPFFILLGFVTLLLAKQPDIGTLIIITCIAIGMYFMAGMSWKQMGALVLVGVIAMFLLIRFEPYRWERIKSFANPEHDIRGASYQVNQAKIAIGAGGIFGVGFGHSSQKLGFLPEPVGDSIFAIMAEELGFVGAMATVALFIWLCFLLTQIAIRTRDPFGRLLVSGVNIWIMAQAFVNIAAISGLAPLTGIPLPFISYGGTAVIALLAGLGIVYNVARE